MSPFVELKIHFILQSSIFPYLLTWKHLPRFSSQMLVLCSWWVHSDFSCLQLFPRATNNKEVFVPPADLCWDHINENRWGKGDRLRFWHYFWFKHEYVYYPLHLIKKLIKSKKSKDKWILYFLVLIIALATCFQLFYTSLCFCFSLKYRFLYFSFSLSVPLKCIQTLNQEDI